MKATILKSSKMYQSWFAILKTDQVHVLVPARGQVNSGRPGQPWKSIDPDRFYQVDVAVLSAAQFQRLVQHISRSWKQAPDTVADWIADRRNGIPLIAGDCVVAMELFT